MTPISSILLIISVVKFDYINCEEPTRRILYGTSAKIKDYPYYAGLSKCGAAIISNKWILTAAHCVENIQSHNKFVWVGGETFQNSQRVPYDEVIVHKDYHYISKIPIHDIALIRLTKPIKFSSKVQPIGLPKSPSENKNAVFVGRGKDESGRVAKSLTKVDVVRLTTEECIIHIPQQYHQFVRKNQQLFTKINICARRYEDEPGVCHGDSGSPLVSDNAVIGLASYIGGDCHKVRLGFYVNVVTYVPWIRSVTGL